MRACVAAGVVLAALAGAPASASEGDDPNRAKAESAAAAFRRGVESRKHLLQSRKHLSDATDLYLELHASGVRSAALYRSLGNAAVLADRWPEAIWAYHVGLQLDPSDQAMRDQLEFVRGKVIHSPTGQGRPEADVWPPWMRRPRIDALAWIFAASYLLTWFAAGCAFATRRTHFFAFTGVLILLTATYGAGLWRQVRQVQIDRDTPLVVMAANADFHRGNGPSYPRHLVLPTLPRGLEARQNHRRGDWLQIRLTTGETGWVHAAQVLIVEP